MISADLTGFLPRRLAFFSLILSMAVALSGMAAAGQAAPPAGAPGQFVQKLGEVALMSLTDKKISRPMREQRVREILQKNFDIQTIGKFAMGTYWREASESQRSEYLVLFENMIVDAYTTRFEDYSGQTLKVDGATSVNATDFIVTSAVVQKNGPPVNLEWRVRGKEGSLKIIDVVVEGISMSVTQRSDFAAVIQRGGGKVDTLLTALRERNKSQKT